MKRKKLFFAIIILLCFVFFTSCEMIKGNGSGGTGSIGGNTNTPNDDNSDKKTHSIGLELALNDAETAYTVLGIGECTEGDIIIPAEHEGLPVKSIDSGAFYNTSITSVVIPEGVENIKSVAFANCYSLEKITLPNSLTKIEDQAFKYCTSLKEVDIPGNISEFGDYVFYECSALESARFNQGTKEIAKGIFNACIALKTVIIPEGVTVISASAFSLCKSLEQIILPSSLKTIEDSAFSGCKSLKEIIIPDSVCELGASIFSECESLESVKLSKNATELRSLVSDTMAIGFFEGCKSLKTVELPEGITHIGTQAFAACTRLIEITIPESVKEIHSMAFSSCLSLTSITIPAGVESIATDAFLYCSTLYEVCNKSAVRIVNKKQYDTDVVCDARSFITDESETRIKKIDGFVFYDEGTDPILIKYVGENKKVVMPEYEDGKKYSIISNVFSAVRDITELTLTDNITDMAHGSLSYCENLETVTFDCPSAEIHSWIMDTNHSIKTVYINADVNYTFGFFKALETAVFGEGVTKIVPQAFKGREIKTVTLSSTITEIGAEAFSNCKKLETVIIPAGSALEAIGDRAFYGTYSLIDLTLPSGVKTIGEEAFHDSVITNITLGDSLTAIGKGAFWRCPRLTTITIPDSVVEIGDEAFMLAEKLKEVVIGENSSLTTIGDEAFTRCTALRSIDLPKSLQSIGKNAFSRTSIARFIIDKENPYFTIINGDIFSKDESLFILHAPSSLMTTYVIPNTVTRIEPYAFAYCEKVTKITFEEGSALESIGEWAFYGMYMTEIIIPASVTTIEAEAFGVCQVLNSVVFEEDSKIETIGESAFDGDHQLEEIRLPGGIKSIGVKAFAWTGIVNLYFDGTLDEWEMVEKGENWSGSMGDYMDRYTIHCTDGIIEKK